MIFKFFTVLCVVFVVLGYTDAFVKRDVSSPPPDPIEAFKKNMDSLKNCIDTSFAQALRDVNVENKLQPIFNVFGDQLNRLFKAFEVLTSPSSSPASLVG
ncbi:unnamed protein product [Arctia plantaginis]|uniref:Uncharacterized protein n=1 Tax=Arctia plantaginis TaxID=874455 RepID=A0A8S0Z3R9_ARCPL|nr:unnamed protein product [Arctia plantaginis]